MIQIFDFTDYRKFVQAALNDVSPLRRGTKARLAESLGCHPSYLSQILAGSHDLSLEQADRANHFFGHTNDQADYFLLLVTYTRAGTESLRQQVFRQIRQRQAEFSKLKNRVKTRHRITESAQQIYYSTWQYAAVGMALTVPGLRTKEALSAHFKLPLSTIAETLDFLLSTGLAVSHGSEFLPGESWIHQGTNTLLANKDHINWRLKSIQAIEASLPQDLRYSSVFSISEADYPLLRSRLIEVIEECRKIIGPSKEEQVCSLLVDLFKL